MALETYQAKRNFKLTPEPRGGKGRSSGNSFVIQKHDATRLHYDFRLEMDGVLKSWAVTKGPSLNPEDRRLAVHVEDHPLSYAVVWDRGNWTPVGDAQQAYREGHLEFELDGEKLKGRWHLVRMHGRPGEKRENWLLIKGDDARRVTTETFSRSGQNRQRPAASSKMCRKIRIRPGSPSRKTANLLPPENRSQRPNLRRHKNATGRKVPARAQCPTSSSRRLPG